MKRLLVIQVAALGYEFMKRHHGLDWGGLTFQPLEPVFPAVTCTAQASFRTARAPSAHGMVANGFLDRRLRRTYFWEQSSALVDGPRIWDGIRARDNSVALFFWQQSLGESVDVILSPAPIHRHHGGMIPDCYCRPPALYEDLCRLLGRPFDLKRYWGPLASGASSRWIAEATARVLADPVLAPDVCLTYLPALDYDLQRRGPDDPRNEPVLAALLRDLAMLRSAADANGYEVLVFGDYAIEPCTTGPVYLNRVLREAGLLQCRAVRSRLYADLHGSRAFAVVDHQVAHVYVPNPQDRIAVRDLLRPVAGVAQVLEGAALAHAGLAHGNAGDLVAVAADGAWFAYPWWSHRREAPDYAGHVDIHQKPGYDPCELLFGWPPGRVSLDPARIRGTHGLTGAGRDAAWASTFLPTGRRSLVELAGAVQQWLEEAL